jgi:hypothetical protein
MWAWWDRFPKKLVVFFIGAAVQLLPLPDAIKAEITKVAAGFLIGQGLADIGKERAKIEAAKVVIVPEGSRLVAPGTVPKGP